MINSDAQDRYAGISGEKDYSDLLIPLDFYEEFQAETGTALRKYIEKYCKDSKIINVVEAGPGTGVTTLELLKTDPRVRVTAVDNELKIVELLQNKFEKIEDLKDRVTFVHADILDFLQSCKMQSFDAFASIYTLHNLPSNHRRKILGLISEKLKPGGIFINGDKYARNGSDHEKDFAAEIKNHDKFDVLALEAEKKGDTEKAAYWRKLKEEGVRHTTKDQDTKITVDEQDEIFNELGFTDVTWGKRHDLVITVSAIKV